MRQSIHAYLFNESFEYSGDLKKGPPTKNKEEQQCPMFNFFKQSQLEASRQFEETPSSKKLKIHISNNLRRSYFLFKYLYYVCETIFIILMQKSLKISKNSRKCRCRWWRHLAASTRNKRNERNKLEVFPRRLAGEINEADEVHFMNVAAKQLDS